MLIFVFWGVVDNVNIGCLKFYFLERKSVVYIYKKKKLVCNYFVLNVSMGAYKENQKTKQENVKDHCETLSSWMKKFIYYNS